MAYSRLFFALAVVCLLSGGLFAAEPGDSSRLDTYVKPNGDSFFALSLSPNIDVAKPESIDVVVLFDTSASQAGAYREKALAALDSLLNNLGPTKATPNRQARIRLVACDVRSVPMSAGFVGPQSAEMGRALARLEKRVPLGATDMMVALQGAIDCFEDEQTARAVVYIGDGMSTANLLGSDQFSKISDLLVKARVPVSSYAIGPSVDSRLLAVLANQTGGNLAIAHAMAWPQKDRSEARAEQENKRNAAAMGEYLANAAHGAVMWPTNTIWPAGIDEVYPKSVPPLRNDRDTVVIGAGKMQGPMAVKMTVHSGQEKSDLSWNVRPNRANADHAYLAELVNFARRDDGATLPTVGTKGLNETRRLIGVDVRNLNNLARHAIATGNAGNADLLAAEVDRRDPGNLLAQAVRGGAERIQASGGNKGGATDLRLVAQREDAGSLLDTVPLDGAFLDAVEQQNRVIEEMIKAEVEAELERSRDRMATDPVGVINDLKLMLAHVKRAPELDPDVRSQLVDQLESALQEANRREVERDEEIRLAQEAAGAARERQRLLDQLTDDQKKVKNLMDRMASLMAEGRYREAEEGVGPEVMAIDPDLPEGVAGILTARITRYHINNQEVRTLRHKGFVDAFHQVELSHIPFPDEPPIVYPDAAVWEELTLRRKKYASVDLKSSGEAEEKIRRALEEHTSFEFIETPLRDVVEYLKDLHAIEIQIDQKALDDVGIGTETPITRNLKGISLRSALRLMLRDLDLTYVIRDEVLLITTPEEVENHLTTKVYPVADLVLPIPESGFQGGFGGLGGFGGNQGAGGGQGFGQGGGGGANGGFGFGGGGQQGGGLFSVPDDPSADTEKPVKTLKLFKPMEEPAQSKDAAGSKKETAPAAAKKNFKSIQIDETHAPEVFWNDYFASHRVEPARLRAAVRELLAARKLDHVVALCQGALRNGQPQSWMYETMGLAMEALGRSKDQIERAMMSAADFVDGPDELMYIAQYMSRLGLDERALKLYRQAATLAPLRAEPYAHGMRIAERLDDLEGIRWTTVGVLSQSWTGENVNLGRKAQHLALAALQKLQKEGRRDEYKAFNKQLDEAMLRDCFVHVSWNGQADIDLFVEEPTGTICSFRNPRTTSGGTMLGDAFSHRGHKSKQGYSETYVCPKGFAGEYKVLMRRVWGKVTTGKLTVDIYTNYRSKNVKHERKHISIPADGDPMVKFELKSGRRTEPLAEHQIVNAAAGQIAVGRAILAQQLAGLTDPNIAQQIARARANDPRFDPRLSLGGGVGFQPVIITLPEGTNMAITGVISADRRYVRITALPVFSGVGDVTTFTFSGGSQVVGPGDMAAGGADMGMDGADADGGGDDAPMPDLADLKGLFCFAAGTAVDTPQGTVAVESIVPGQTVLAFDVDSGRTIETKVLELQVHPEGDELLKLRLSGDRKILVTPGHPFFTGESWRRSERLLPGDTVLRSTGDRLEVEDIQPAGRADVVYNVVTEAGTYLVGGGVVVSSR